MKTKLIFLVLIFGSLFVIWGFLNHRFNFSSNNQTVTVKLVSLPPRTAVYGKEWMYTLNIKGYDPKRHEVEVSAPEWLEFDKENLVLKGTVPSNAKDFKIKVVVYDKKSNKVLEEKEFTIKVVPPTKTGFNFIDYKNSPSKSPNKIVLKLKPTYKEDNQFHEGEVLGARTSNVPDTAVSPLMGFLMGVGLIVLGVALYRIKMPFKNAYIKTNSGTIKY